ncbi:hypothetical protein Aspvir_001992 [Aspergillus viridinutans]|uniref:Cytochrome P450 n=1 Tax=Aspergillus viridinutans TaxID=75553 RepID=A0A9P3F5Y1_ASPVI|nr:uncharacterized protein Aspvir_001992 [Aspergillus viridinutans]GIK06344.1 hypothetical protein Aspvir_001992 [Aspergillus viridinutans]
MIQTALVLLAVHPELQQEIHEELDVIYGEKSEGEGLVYESDYPKMRRVIALMLETLRLFPSISGIPKWTSDKPQIAHYNGQPFDIPQDTSIVLDVVAVHCNPRYWGEDANVFRPSRWLMDETYEPLTNSVSHSKHHLNMLCPRKGAFIVFSDGHRDCLGKGFLDRVGTSREVYTIRCCMERYVSKRMEGSGRQKEYDELQNVWESPVRFVPRGWNGVVVDLLYITMSYIALFLGIFVSCIDA